jgi:hypothetical protein
MRLTPAQLATDRIIIVSYPSLSGGKFLINSLALSQHAVLQHCDLTELDSKEKLDLLCDRYDSTHNTWTDIDLGCGELFGVDQSPGVPIDQEYHGIIVDLIKQQKYFFVVTHALDHLAHVLKIWPNAKVIHFTNCQEFILTYRWPLSQPHLIPQMRALKNWWKRHKKVDWPARPPCTIIEFQKPEYQRIAEHINSIKSILAKPLAKEGYPKYQTLLGATNWNHQWDAEWYLDWGQYRLHIEMLYTQLGFDDFDSDKIRKLYDCWISAMQRHLEHMIAHC